MWNGCFPLASLLVGLLLGLVAPATSARERTHAQDEVGHLISADFLGEAFTYNMILYPLESVRVLLLTDPLVDLVAQLIGLAQRVLQVLVVRVLWRRVLHNLSTTTNSTSRDTIKA